MGIGCEVESDVDLLRASREGGSGFAVFYRRHRDAVLAFHAQRVADAERAADLTAETFAAALLGVHDPAREVPEVPVAWLFSIARRKLIDSYRRGVVEDAARRRLALERIAVDELDIERINATAGATDVALELARQLPPDQFEALRARVLDERDYAEIARAQNCSEAAVRMRVSRALKTLRNRMEARHDRIVP
jgi:RNA polymerase sigma factor (sigma-70 family)